jgi:hypothetical protein
MSNGSKVWLIEENVIGEILVVGAWYSQVKFFVDGVEHIEFLENEDFLPYEVYGEE